MTPRILHIDDDPLHMEIVREVLDDVQKMVGMDWDFSSCNSPKAGLDAIRAWSDDVPSLVISDYVMPGMTGVQLMHQAMEECDATHVRYVLLTSLRVGREHKEAIKSGVAEILDKPMDLDEFHETMAGVIGRWVATFAASPDP